jgi:hypothetical protein
MQHRDSPPWRLPNSFANVRSSGSSNRAPYPLHQIPHLLSGHRASRLINILLFLLRLTYKAHWVRLIISCKHRSLWWMQLIKPASSCTIVMITMSYLSSLTGTATVDLCFHGMTGTFPRPLGILRTFLTVSPTICVVCRHCLLRR